MSEPPPTGVAQNAAVADHQALTPEAVEAVLADFRAWLAEFAAAPPAGEPPAAGEAVDLHTLLGHFIALRHEVNLQTKASRAQLEQNAEALRQLAQAHDSLCKAQAAAQDVQEQGQEELLRPLLKTLLDLHDALSLGWREAQRVRDAVLPVLERMLSEAEPEAEPPPAAPSLMALESRPFWAFWRSMPSHNAAEVHAQWEAWWERDVQRRQARVEQLRQNGERLRQMLTALITGYTMSLQRVERAVRQHGLEPLPAEGEPFDPETMEVVEAVTDSGHAPGTVIEEVRRGYLWEGRVFRYAQVRVARS